MADEFDTIAKLFAPLATHAGARGLLDDAAVLGNLVLTTDAIVEGVHFLADDPIETVAKKALRVNLSDIAAKGAKPVGVLVALMWPQGRDAREIAAFARGLGEDLRAFDAPLLGGDTTSTPGPLAVSVTVIGEALGRTPARADARAGEDVWVTGTIGDGMLGLQHLGGSIAYELPEEDTAYLIDRYRTPTPRLAFAAAIAAHASASMDVSDGLTQDAAKIAAASKLAVDLDLAAIPLSAPAQAWVAEGGDVEVLMGGGDDYELLFTAPPGACTAIEAAARATGLQVTRIGRTAAGAGVTADGAPIRAGGYRHKLGR